MGRVTSPAALVCLAWLTAGCKSAALPQPPTAGSCPPCTRVSFADRCGGDTSQCDLTWDDVLKDRQFCDACTDYYPWRTYDAGGYHVLTQTGIDTGASVFYDARTGDLVATASYYNGFCSCQVSDAVAGFVPPTTSVKPSLPGWCSPDAGAPGERVFSCCRDSIDSCVQSHDCPSWSDVQPDGFWCRGGAIHGAFAVSACGGFNLLRYGVGGGTDQTIYYDTVTNAPIAGVDSDGLCRYGPANGITLPDCSPTFTPTCPGGGTDASTD